jgi:hypothetical protein
MIIKRVFCPVIFSETLISPVIIMSDSGSCPAVVAFDSKVIITFPGQGAMPAIRFDYPLGKSDAGRNTCPSHLGYSKILV